MHKNRIQTRNLHGWFAAVCAIVLLNGCSNYREDDMDMMADNGQCWSQQGGVGNLLKNSATRDECRELGGKSWCPVGGGCENL